LPPELQHLVREHHHDRIIIPRALLTCAYSALAHGIAGNRFFVHTLTIDVGHWPDLNSGSQRLLYFFQLRNERVRWKWR
jgi:hypothetical protein